MTDVESISISMIVLSDKNNSKFVFSTSGFEFLGALAKVAVSMFSQGAGENQILNNFGISYPILPYNKIIDNQ